MPNSEISGAWSGKIPIAPSAPGTCASVTCSRITSRSGVAISSSNVAAIAALCLLHLLGAFQHVFDRALQIERLFRHLVVLALDHFLQSADRVAQLHILS